MKTSREVLDLKDEMGVLSNAIAKLVDLAGFCSVMGYDEGYIEALEISKEALWKQHRELLEKLEKEQSLLDKNRRYINRDI